MDEEGIRQLEAKAYALEELLSVSEACFLEESTKLEEVNGRLRLSVKEHESSKATSGRCSTPPATPSGSSSRTTTSSTRTSPSCGSKGFAASDLLGMKCHDVYQEEECLTERCELEQVIRGGMKTSREVRVTSPGGVETPFLVTAAPYTNAAGEIVGGDQKLPGHHRREASPEGGRRERHAARQTWDGEQQCCTTSATP